MSALLVKMLLACVPVVLFVVLCVAMEFASPRKVLSFWDRLFGTTHHPQPDEWPATGIATLPRPLTFLGLLTHLLHHFRSLPPFGRRSG